MKIRKKGCNRMVLLLVTTLLLSGCADSKSQDTTAADAITVKKNQEIVIGKITEIAGNEVTYTVAKEVDQQEDTSKNQKNSDTGETSTDRGQGKENASSDKGQSGGNASSEDMGQKGENAPSDKGQSGGNAPSDMGQKGENTPPDMEQSGGNAPSDMGQREQNTSNSNTTSDSNRTKKSTQSNKKKTMYTLTEKSQTKTIPVGTTVTTSLGNKTTFSRLSNGDVIKMLMEKDKKGEQVIVGIWMVG